VANTLAEQAAKNELAQNEMRQKIQELASKLAAAHVAPPSALAPVIRTYESIDITKNSPCSVTLDAVCLNSRGHRNHMFRGDKRR